MIHRFVNGAMDAYCWSGVRGASYMLSRTSHPGYTLQLTIFHRGHAWGDINVKHAGKGELSLPDGVCAVGIEHADSGVEEELAERFGIYITPDVYERFGCVGEGPSAGIRSIGCAGCYPRNIESGALVGNIHYRAVYIVKTSAFR